MELPKHDEIRTSGENETYKYLVSWRLIPSNKWKWKTTFEKNISGELEKYSRQNSPAETSSRE